MNEITITLPNGIKLTGTQASVVDTAKKLGYGDPLKGMHWSHTRQEFVPIAGMNQVHIKNSVLLQYREWIDNVLAKAATPADFVRLIQEGPTGSELVAMILELKTRKEW